MEPQDNSHRIPDRVKDAIMIEAVDEVLKRTPRGYKVVTRDPVLAPFLAPGGDYTFFVACPALLDEEGTNSGNLISWRSAGDTVVLTHADSDDAPECRIKRSVLEKVISLLAHARGERLSAAAPRREKVTKKTKKKAKRARSA
jgi:hypothetical protein